MNTTKALEKPNDQAWVQKTSPFPLPTIIKGLVGMTSYRLRKDVKEALMKDDYSKWGL